jgi:pyridoxamine 5'-phosphate oxidase
MAAFCQSLLARPSHLPTMPQYTQNPPLDIADLDADPLAQLQRWLDDAAAAPMIEPTAMTLATVDAQGRPSARIVLFKGFHGEGLDRGLTFYTNYDSRKGRELAGNAHVALVFWWDKLERSVRIEGRVGKLPHEVSERYFHSRPHESQVGALTSRQSAVVRAREVLDQRYDEQLAAFA